MDLVGVESVRIARSRADLALRPGESPLAGGTWLYSLPDPNIRGLVDLAGLGWPPIEVADGVVRIAATCTLAQLRAGADALGTAAALVPEAVEALLGSWKIHRIATVGGNLCTALPAGPMTSLFAGLGAVAVIWTADGGERRLPVADFVTGVQRTALRPGELLRAVELAVPDGVVALRRISLAPLGRSAAFVVGRRDRHGLSITVTASVPSPRVLRWADPPDAGEPARALGAIRDWYDDPHGAPDWRRAMTLRLAEDVRSELAAA